MSKSKILILTGHYLPGYKGGGPIVSIKNMVEHLCDEFEFKIITSDRDIGDTQSYPNIIANKWNLIEEVNIFYAAPEYLTFCRLVKLINDTDYDILYINSLFSKYFSIYPLLAIRTKLLSKMSIIIAPRGELEIGALKIRKNKKYLFIFFAKMIGLYTKLIWQASSEYESKSIKKVMGKVAVKVKVAKNLTPKVEDGINYNAPTKLINSKNFRICFISRIARKKNLDFAISVLMKTKRPIIFDIYGPIEDKIYWGECEKLIKKVPSNIEIRYKGSIKHNAIIEIFRTYDLFFFPTHSENFGHVIIESMLAGTPVLIANTTPWRNLEEKNAGWVYSLKDQNSFIDKINCLSLMNSFEYFKYKKGTLEYAKAQINNDTIYKANRALFCDVD